MRLLEDNIGEKLLDIGFDIRFVKDFLDMTPKAQFSKIK